MVDMNTYSALKPKGISDGAWLALIDAWENGFNDREAAYYATKASRCSVLLPDLKRWMKENPDLEKLRDHLVNGLTMTAKMNIAREINSGNAAMSKWYLERKSPEEFSTRSSANFEGVVELSLEEKQKELSKLIKEFRDE